MQRLLTLFSLALFTLYQFGCSSEDSPRLENPVAEDTLNSISAAPLPDDVVLQNMYTDETELLPDKARIQIVTVLEGTGRVTIEARYRGVRDFGFGFPVYECELLDQSIENMGGIAQGMSGSPVGPPGYVMGALAYGDAFAAAPTRFWVTAIDAMEATRDRLTLGDRLTNKSVPAAPSAGISSTYVPVKTPLTITGIQPHRLSQIEAHLEGHHLQYLQMFSSVGGKQQAPVVTRPNLAAGDMIGVGIATGDVVNAIGFGTVTQVYDDGTFLAFGHPMTQSGKTAMPVYRAVVNGIVPNLQISYKSSYAFGDPIGTITKDLLPCIVGELGTVVEMIPVKVTYQLDTDEVLVKNHKVAYGLESFISLITALTFDSIRQEVNFGTVTGTITLKFAETETVYTEKFYAPSSDPFSDVLSYVSNAITSFTDIQRNSTGKATLKDVSISVMDSPEIRLATVHEVIAPESITLGETATFTITLLPHWTSVENGRKIEKVVTLDVPEGWTADQVQLEIVSQYPYGPPSPLNDLFGDFLNGEDFEETEALLDPENLDQLIQRKSENLVEEPGLLSIVLSPAGGFSFGDDFFFDDQIPQISENPEMLQVDEGLPEQASAVETEIVIEDFIVVGTKRVTVNVVE